MNISKNLKRLQTVQVKQLLIMMLLLNYRNEHLELHSYF